MVKAGATHILVDAGRGVVMRMVGAGSMPPFQAGDDAGHPRLSHTPEQYPERIEIAAAHFDGEIIMGDDLATITI